MCSFLHWNLLSHTVPYMYFMLLQATFCQCIVVVAGYAMIALHPSILSPKELRTIHEVETVLIY